MASRQAAWSAKQHKEGRCVVCGGGKGRLKTKRHCEFHAKQHSEQEKRRKVKLGLTKAK
jgi:hypothetical protein